MIAVLALAVAIAGPIGTPPAVPPGAPAAWPLGVPAAGSIGTPAAVSLGAPAAGPPAPSGTPPGPSATPPPGPSGAPLPSPSATPPAGPSGTPLPGPSAGPTSTPSAAPSELPSPTAAPTHSPLPYKYRFVPRQPAHVDPGQPQIFAVYLNDQKLRSHGPIAIRVQTNADVVKVISRNNGREGVIPATGPGIFEATSTLPKIPFIAAGMTVDLEFVATSADGRKISVRVPVRLD